MKYSIILTVLLLKSLSVYPQDSINYDYVPVIHFADTGYQYIYNHVQFDKVSHAIWYGYQQEDKAKSLTTSLNSCLSTLKDVKIELERKPFFKTTFGKVLKISFYVGTGVLFGAAISP